MACTATMPDLPSGCLNEANGVRRFRPCPSCSTGDITPYALDGRGLSLLRELENWITEQGATAWPIAMHGWHFSTCACVSLHLCTCQVQIQRRYYHGQMAQAAQCPTGWEFFMPIPPVPATLCAIGKPALAHLLSCGLRVLQL